MGILPRDPDGGSCPPDGLLGCNGEEATKTTVERVQAHFETLIPGQTARFADLNLDFPGIIVLSDDASGE